MGPDGEPSSAEGFILKRMLLEKGRHVLQAGIRCGFVFLHIEGWQAEDYVGNHTPGVTFWVLNKTSYRVWYSAKGVCSLV